MKPIRPLMNPRQQPLVAALLVLSLAAIGFFFWQQYGDGRQVIDVDETTRYSNDFVVDINTAGVEEIANLPAVGPVLANEIVSFRERHGPFVEVADLLKVPGIGEKKLKMLQAYLAPLEKASESP